MKVIRLYTPSYCIFCKILEPRLKWFCKKYNLELKIYKVNEKNKIAHQINGVEVFDASEIPSYPCVVYENYVFIGLNIIKNIKKILNHKI